MKQHFKRLTGLLLALAIIVGSFPSAALAAPEPEEQVPAVTEENTAAPSGEQDEAAEETAQPAEDTEEEAAAEPAEEPAEESAEQPEEEAAEPAAQQEAEAGSEMVKADAKIITKQMQDKITEEVYKGNTVIDVSEYNASVAVAEDAASETVEANTAVSDAKVGADKDGNATVIVADVDPVMEMAIAEANENGSLTEEEKQQLIYVYGQYQESITGDNAKYFGVQCPYFTTKDTTENPVGSLLSIANIKQREDGSYYKLDKDGKEVTQKIDDLTSTVQLFTTANQFAMQYYGQELLDTAEEALSVIKDGMTVPQKLLALNDWVAQHAEFDMPYIMSEDLQAEDPQEHPKKAEITAAMESQLKEQIRPMIREQVEASFKENIEAELKKQLMAPEEEGGKGMTEEQANAEMQSDEMQNQVTAKLQSEQMQAQIDQVTDQQTNDYAAQYAQQMAQGVIDSWEGNQWGILTSAHGGKGVCMGYSYAYAYLVQCAFPEIYKNEDGSWKTYQELNYVSEQVEIKNEDGTPALDENGQPMTETKYTWNENTPAMVDFVRINFDADVRMFGQTNEGFDSEHYWNAAKVDGKWYYVDPCYTDGYIEFMQRERVETNGNMNHLYFMFSDTNARKLYEGYYSSLNTLYENIATDTTYEDAWFAFAKSPVSVVNGKYYYFYDSTDMIEQKTNYQQNQEKKDTEYKLVVHEGADNADFTELVNFNNGTVLKDGSMVENQLVKDLYAKHQAYQKKYPSVAISGAVSDGKFYFNIANCILTYDLSSGEVVKVKEYNKVSATRDKTDAFGGMAFDVVKDGTEGALTVLNNPIAGMTVKDGSMYVDVATNYAYISGREVDNSTTHEAKENTGYGWEYEETNYNPEYSVYMEQMLQDNPSYAGMIDYEDQDNDNDEFMWTANFTDTVAMSDLTGSHEYEKVTIDPTCGENGYTENRCKTCGAIEAGSREETENSALDHHYVQFDEVYYEHEGDNEANAYKTGTSYVCVICKDAQEEKPENMGDHSYKVTFEWAEDYSTAKATRVCTSCSNKLDCLLGAESAEQTVDAEITSKRDGKCDEVGTITYTATAKFGETTYTDEKQAEAKAGEHSYTEPEFTWSEDGKSCKASYKCTNGDDDHTGDNAVAAKVDDGVTTDATCIAEGKTVYTASIKLNGKDYTSTKEVTIPKKPHDFKDGVCTVCGAKKTPEQVNFKVANAADGVKISWTADENMDFYRVYRKNSKGKWARVAQVSDTGAWVDTSAASGSTYTYTVRAGVVNDGKEALGPYESAGTAIKYLSQPKFSVSNKANGVEIKWSKVTGASGYRVYNKTTGNWVKLTTAKSGAAGSFVDTTAKSGTTYNYTVKAISGSYMSSYKTDTQIERLAQPAPSVSNKANGAAISWKAVEGAASYRIYRRSSTSDSWGSCLAEVKGTSYVDQTAKSGSTYLYTVKAMDGKQMSSYVSGAKIKYLAQPKVTLSNTASAVNVKWGRITGASGYRVYRRTTGDWTRIATISSGSTVSYNDKTAKAGVAYKYAVRAVSGSYLSSYDANVQITRLTQPSVSAANAASGVKVTWSKVTGATGYRVYRKTTGKWGRIADIDSGSTVNYTDKTAKSGTTYSYTVRAVTEKDISSYSSGAKIKRLAQPAVSVAKASNGISVKWNKITGASGYRVYRRTTGGWSRIANVSGGSAVSYTDKTAKSGTTYQYTVRAAYGDYLSSYAASESIKYVNDANRTVYITKTGKRYHYDNSCNGGTYYKSTLSEARAKGLTPCDKCVK